MKLSIIFTLLFSSAIAQQKFSDVYYPYIDKAEMAFINNNYTEAFDFYMQAFAAVKQPLARDIWNAAACKIISNDFDAAKPFLIRLAKLGISSEILAKEPSILRLGENWESFKLMYDQIHSQAEPQLPDEAIQLIKEWQENPTLQNGGYYAVKLGTITYKPEEAREFRARLESYLDSTRGFSETQDFVGDEEFLCNSTNELLLSFKVGFYVRRSESKKVEFVKSETKIDQEKYLLEGIESGKWHRDILAGNAKVLLAEVKVEEDCNGKFDGYFFNKIEGAGFSFTEEAGLLKAKGLYNMRENELFRVRSPVSYVRKDYASCKAAAEELKDWIKL